MPVRPGQRVYQSGAFEVIGLLGQLLVALPNLALFAGAAVLWLRIAGLGLATLYVCVLLLRGFLPDRMLEAAAEPQGGLAAFQIRLRAGNRRVVVPVTLAAVLVAGVSLFGGAALAVDSNPPAAPGHLRSTGATAQQVDLAWDAVADEGGPVREYRVLRRDNGLERASTSTTFHDTLGIGGGVRYDYTVVAVDRAGNVSRPSAVSVTTPVSDATACARDTTPPSPPGAPHATVVMANAVTLEWDGAKDAGSCGLAGYQVLRDGQDTGMVSAGSQVTEDGLEPDHSYVYTVVAKDNAGNLSSPSEPVTVATLARPVQTQSPCELGPPQALKTTGHTTTTVALTWSRPDQDCHLDGYRVYRGGSYVGQTGGTSFTVTGLAPSTSYVFTVRAHNSDGEMSSNSNPASATTGTPPSPTTPGTPTPPPDTTPPTAPGPPILFGWAPATQTLTVSWTASTDPQSGIKQYEVHLSGPQVVAVVSPVPPLKYAFANLNPYSSYTVGVAAVNNVGLQSSIVESTLTTGAGPGGVTAGLSLDTISTDTGGQVTVSGGNTAPLSAVDITLTGHGPPTSVTSESNGAYAATFDFVPDGAGNVTVGGYPLPDGSYAIDVSASDGSSKQLWLTVVTPAPPPDPSPSP
jgi:chitodextrinase